MRFPAALGSGVSVSVPWSGTSCQNSDARGCCSEAKGSISTAGREMNQLNDGFIIRRTFFGV